LFDGVKEIATDSEEKWETSVEFSDRNSEPTKTRIDRLKSDKEMLKRLLVNYIRKAIQIVTPSASFTASLPDVACYFL